MSTNQNYMGSLVSTPTPFNLTRPINITKVQKSSSGGPNGGIGVQSSDSQTNTPAMGSVKGGTPTYLT